MKMRASTCDVASRTSFDSSGDEDGRESVLGDQADGAAYRAAHCGNRGVGYLRVEGRTLERTISLNRGGQTSFGQSETSVSLPPG